MTAEINPNSSPNRHAKLIRLWTEEFIEDRLNHWLIDFKTQKSEWMPTHTNVSWHQTCDYRMTMLPTHPDYIPPKEKQEFNGEVFEFELARLSAESVTVWFKSTEEAERFFQTIK